MTTFNFLVQGSEPDPYETSFSFDGKNLAATCTCRAGEIGQSCKHRLEILKGNTSSIVSNNKSDMSSLLRVFENSPLDIKLKELDAQEKELKKLQNTISATKKQIARIMLGE